jgi:hypothetical protein
MKVIAQRKELVHSIHISRKKSCNKLLTKSLC